MNKLLILDIDGVMTDGTKVYDREGNVVHKRFADQDYTAIRLFRARGWDVCFLSSDDFNRDMASRRGIDFWHSRLPDGTINKVGMLPDLSKHYDVEIEEMVYVGDDIFDAPVMFAIKDGGGKCYCPKGSAPFVARHFDMICRTGGTGVVMALYDSIYGDNVNV